MANALSRRHSLLTILDARVFGFRMLREHYVEDEELRLILVDCEKGANGKFTVHNGYLFKKNQLCVPKGSFRKLLIKETHVGSLPWHFRVNKILELLKEHFYWSRMKKDVQAILSRCGTCQRAKSQFKSGPYIPLPVPIVLWEDISIDFVVALPRTQRGRDSIMVIVDRLSKMAHFILCHKTDDVILVAGLFSERYFDFMGF